MASRANYETAREFGVPVVIMEPVKGGSLAKPPKEVEKLFRDYAPASSCASWAIRFAASLEGVLAVLSGMSNTAQMRDNLSYMEDFVPLSEEERRIIFEVQRLMGRSGTVPCTGCGYCTAGCPREISIPSLLAALNRYVGSGQHEGAKEDYLAAVSEGGRAGDCIGCKKCEGVCPQHLPITEHLQKCRDIFD